MEGVNKNKDSCPVEMISRGQESEKVAATYSPTWWGSTIGDGGLNFSVRNGNPRRYNRHSISLERDSEDRRQSRAHCDMPDRLLNNMYPSFARLIWTFAKGCTERRKESGY